jgi:hypothetical protein
MFHIVALVPFLAIAQLHVRGLHYDDALQTAFGKPLKGPSCLLVSRWSNLERRGQLRHYMSYLLQSVGTILTMSSG